MSTQAQRMTNASSGFVGRNVNRMDSEMWYGGAEMEADVCFHCCVLMIGAAMQHRRCPIVVVVTVVRAEQLSLGVVRVGVSVG